jgi:hypothetical protein
VAYGTRHHFPNALSCLASFGLFDRSKAGEQIGMRVYREVQLTAQAEYHLSAPDELNRTLLFNEAVFGVAQAVRLMLVAGRLPRAWGYRPKSRHSLVSVLTKLP